MGMLYSQNKSYGPNSPAGWIMVYWKQGTNHPIAEWWARMTAILILGFFSAPFWAGVSMDAHMKQCMLVMTGMLINMAYIIFTYPNEAESLTWYPQLGLQVILVGINAYILMPKPKRNTTNPDTSGYTAGSRKSPRKKN